MKTFLSFILILSIAVNIGFFTGCAAFHNAVYGVPCKIASAQTANRRPVSSAAKDSGRAELVRIAELLGIQTSGKSADALAGDIRYVLDRSEAIPAELSNSTQSEAKRRLPPDAWREIEEHSRFVSDLQGKRVIAFTPEE